MFGTYPPRSAEAEAAQLRARAARGPDGPDGPDGRRSRTGVLGTLIWQKFSVNLHGLRFLLSAGKIPWVDLGLMVFAISTDTCSHVAWKPCGHFLSFLFLSCLSRSEEAILEVHLLGKPFWCG